MDRELFSLVRAVKNGAIQDPDHVRDILRDARMQIDQKQKRLYAHEKLLLDARDAFVGGWKDDAVAI
jgi:hypothetical protein